MPKEIGFVTRNYPPRIGGLERAAFDWYHSMSQEMKVHLLKHDKSKWLLPLFILKAPWILIYWRLQGIRTIHLHDASLCILMWPWTNLFREVTCTVNGLDAVFPNPIYQFLLRLCRKKVTLFLPISESTLQSCIDVGFDASKLKFMPDGIIPQSHFSTSSKTILKQEAHQYFGITNDASLTILWVGRMIPRKGLFWFVSNVLPELDRSVSLWVVGTGEEAIASKATVKADSLNAHFFGSVSDHELTMIRQAADLFIMPNIYIEGDKEGFGLVSLEANDAGLWVLASNIDGIPSAVHDKKNGSLIESGNSDAWIEKINTFLRMPPQEVEQRGLQAKSYAHENFSWAKLAKRWRTEIYKC